MKHHRKVLRRLRERLRAQGYARITVRVRRTIDQATGRRSWLCVIYRGVAMTPHAHAIEARRVGAIRAAFRSGGVR
jgi:hypothetical protein